MTFGRDSLNGVVASAPAHHSETEVAAPARGVASAAGGRAQGPASEAPGPAAHHSSWVRWIPFGRPPARHEAGHTLGIAPRIAAPLPNVACEVHDSPATKSKAVTFRKSTDRGWLTRAGIKPEIGARLVALAWFRLPPRVDLARRPSSGIFPLRLRGEVYGLAPTPPHPRSPPTDRHSRLPINITPGPD